MTHHERIPIGPGAPQEVHTIIEVPKGASNKYKYNPDAEVFRYEKTLFSPLFYPYDYGWICGTRVEHDGKPLNCLVIASNPTFAGCLILARPIGTLLLYDSNGEDHKILCVAVRDPRFAGIHSLANLPTHTLLEVQHFFEIYQALEQREVRIDGWEDVAQAHARIQAAVANAQRQAQSLAS